MAKYIVTVSSDYEELIVMKTTVASPSDSDWAVAGDKLSLAPGRARDATQDKIIVASSVEDGSDIHIVTQQLSGRVAYHVFDPGTDAWTVEDQEVGVPRLEDTSFEARPTTEARLSAGICLRADGDVIVIAAHNDGTDDDLRLWTEEGSGWVNRDVAGFSGGRSITVCPIPHSSSDRIIWVYSNLTDEGVETNSISSGNVFSLFSTIDLSADTAEQKVGAGVYLSSNSFVAPYIDASNKVSLYELTIVVSPPSLTQYTDRSSNTVYGHGRTTAPFSAFCLAVESDDTVHLLYADDSTQDLFHQPDATNATPPSEVEELDGVTVNRISCRVVNSDADLYVAYDDAGTLKFLDISLGAAPVVQRAKLSLLGVGV